MRGRVRGPKRVSAASSAIRARFRMIARREASDGRREARTQGAPISLIWARLRTPHHGVQHRIGHGRFIPKWALIPPAACVGGTPRSARRR